MALQPISPRSNPYGFFDGLDSDIPLIKGGEVAGLTYVPADKKANDVFDGYVSNSSKLYPAVTVALEGGMRPLFLTDDGISHYGTLFGSLVGSFVGQDSVGTVIGPHTASGSGKITLWDEPGFYTVTLDATDPDETTGLQTTNTTITGNAGLYAMSGSVGKLTPNVVVAVEALVVARFIEFTSNRSLVTTPLSLVSAPNSPIGGTGKKGLFDRALIHFDIED